MTRSRMMLSAAVITVLSTRLANAADPSIAFDSLTGAVFGTGGWGFFNQPETGQVITLVGVGRTVTQIDVAVTNFHPEPFDLDTDFKVRFYRLDGPGGFPGTRLWESDLAPVHIPARIPQVLSVPVPNVSVPTTFAWTIEEFRTSTVLSAAVPGMHPLSGVEFGPLVSKDNLGTWIFDVNQPRAVRVYAIPEPAAISVGALATVLGIAARRQRTARG